MKADELESLRAVLLEKMAADAGKYIGRVERFPHVFKKIVQLWGTADLDLYFKELMLTKREHRDGFPPEVALDILRLASIHQTLGLTKEPEGSIWEWAVEIDVARSERA